MKINESTSTATIVGDVQSNAVSIDINNIGFITQLLSTNLYSKPIESFLREIVSNAWDSHVEAGVQKPILLEIGTDTENRNYCRIQDFGVGLSPQRFNDVYRNIGSSTKRSDNTQIGGFGIGRFSALAYSGTVYLTSNYEGIKYKYLMYKDGNHIKIDELFQDTTTDEDGLEVMVYIKNGDYYDFKRAIKTQLCYFEDIYLTLERYSEYSEHLTFANDFNNLKIKRFDNFSVNTYNGSAETTLCLGKIQYPLNKYSLTNTKFKFDALYPITVNFEIGDLEVTPNREQILYTKENIKKIEEKLDLVQEELDDIINDQIKEDYDDFEDFINNLKNPASIVTLYENPDPNVIDDVVVFKVKRSTSNITFRGEILPKHTLKLYDFIYNKIHVKDSDISCKIENGRIFTKNITPWGMSFKTIGDRIVWNNIYVGDHSEFNGVTKDYIREHCSNTSMFLKPKNKNYIIKTVLKEIQSDVKRNGIYSDIKYDKKIIKLIMVNVLNRLLEIPIINNSLVPDSFIKERLKRLKDKRSASGVSSVNWNEEVNLFILRRSERSTYNTLNVATDSERYKLDTLRKDKGWSKVPVIYAEKGSESLRELFYIFDSIQGSTYNKYRFVEIAPTKIKILEQFRNFIKLEDFMNVEYKKIRMLATAHIISKKYPHMRDIYQMGTNIEKISKKLRDVSITINTYLGDNLPKYSYYGLTPDLLTDVLKICEDNNYYDEEMMGFINSNIKIIENSKFLTLICSGNFPSDMVNFAVDYVLARRLFIPNIQTVKILREETIFNIKKEKDENN